MDQSQPAFLLDGLFCLESNFERGNASWRGNAEFLQNRRTHAEDDYFHAHWSHAGVQIASPSSGLLQHGAVCGNEELESLLSKEEVNPLDDNHTLPKYRVDAVKWMLKVIGYYSFSCLTAALAVNYFDRFIRRTWLPTDKPWMAQLAAVACLSLAAKVEETHVPSLVDLKVDDTELVFESKTITRMEISVLSTLEWKMHPVTPLAFIDIIIYKWIPSSRFLSSELRRRCELVILFILKDHRLTHYPPSIVATAVLLHVIKGQETCFGSEVEVETQLLSVLGIDGPKLDDCRKLITVLFSDERRNQLNKRKFAVVSDVPGSPDGVIDVSFSSESCCDAWTERSASSSVSSSPEPISKKGKALPDGIAADVLSSTTSTMLSP